MTPALFDLSGRVALVTGSSRGIGRAIATTLAQHGADLVVHHLDEPEEAASLAQAIGDLGRRVITVASDLSDETAADALVATAIDALGAVDILVINAAVERRQDWTEVTRRDLEYGIALNVWSTLRLMQLCVPRMVERGWGRVLTIGSIQQVRPNPRAIVYAAMKTAQVNMVRNVARQVAASGVTVNNMAPGSILTPRSERGLADPVFRAQVEAKIPMGRIGLPQDCAGAALLLCSDAGGYITGADLPVDGGWSVNDA